MSEVAETSTYMPHPPEYLPVEQFTKIVESINLTPPWGWRNRAILETAYYMGLRRSEIIRLQTDQVDLTSDHPHLEVRGSKYGKGRNIPIDPRAMHALRMWALRRPASDHFFCTVIWSPGIASGNTVGSPLTGEQISNLLKCRAAAVGLDRRVWLHLLRHSAATNWLRNGLNIEQVRLLLGHSRITTTQRYLHVSMTDIEKIIYGDTAPLVDMKLCPFCAEQVKIQATRCKHCHGQIGDVA